MKLTITIEFGNSVMTRTEHATLAIAKCDSLRRATATKPDSGSIRDVNGNTVGTWEICK